MEIIYRNSIKYDKQKEVILYTVKDYYSFSQLMENHMFFANKKIVTDFWKEWSPNFISSYRWINNECKKRIKNYKYDSPVWAWLKRPNANSLKIEYKDQPFYIIEFKAKLDEILVSDFEKWHFVLNNLFLPKNLNESFPHNMEHNQKEIINSWNNIFDIDDNLKQACLGCISLDSVLKITKYTQKI